MKYTILKFLDVTGFTFLSPIVRLVTGEEPAKQIKEIGQFIVLPVVAFVAFIYIWAYLAPRHKTKSGEVPTPQVTAEAATSIWEFHEREGNKEIGYRLSGTAREQVLSRAKSQIEQLKSVTEERREAVAEAEKEKEAFLAEKAKPLTEKLEALTKKTESDQADRVKELEQIAQDLSSEERRSELVEKTHLHSAQSEKEESELKELRSERDSVLGGKFPPLVAAQKALTEVAEKQQYWGKMVEQLDTNNRSRKVEKAENQLAAAKAELDSASGTDAVKLAARIEKIQARIQKIQKSEYAKPWTLPNQTIRSVACVFFGFFLGAAIAIPVGILCGLSRSFMAAVTPFVALFKPVSPIVWLPISLIIVGGFIQDPDKHWLMQFLWELPLIGWMKINPAFIASGVTVALCSLWPTLVNTALGVASIDQDHINVARVLRLGFWSRLTKIIIPSSLPLIFAGLRISLGVGWMVLIAAELLASSEGIGKFVWDQFNNGASDSFAKMFVVVFVVGSIGFILDRLMIIFQRLVSFDGAQAAL